MINFLKLIRIQNLVIVVLTQYLMRWCVIYPILKVNNLELQFPEFDFFLLVLATVLLTAAGYIINDYFDRKTDLLNRPETVIVGKYIGGRMAIILHLLFSGIATVIGFYISYKINVFKFGLVFPIIAGILWFYSTTYKRQLLIGNVIVATLTAMVPMMVFFFEIPMMSEKYSEIIIQYNLNVTALYFWLFGFSFFAFITTIIREIIKDIEDLEGDNAYGRNTLPISIGIKNTKIILLILIAITIFALYFLHFKYLNDSVSLIYFTFLLSIPLVFLSYRLTTANEKKHYTFASTLTKIVMFFGILYSLLISYQIHSIIETNVN